MTSITNDVSDSTGRRALTREQRRVLTTPKYQATATGGAGLAANQSEDDALVVGGQDLQSIQQNAATADSDYSATGGGKVNYDEALAAEMSNSNIFNIIGLLLIIFALTF